MNKREFLNEVLASGICPKDFESLYQEFMGYQKIVWDALLAFRDVCEKHTIPYQLAFGTLLGAVRDKGQIPWDYDIDVLVPADFREELVSALKADLDEAYYFDCADVNPQCRNEILRIAPKGYRTEVVHLDVFFLAGTPEDEQECQAFTQRIRFLCSVRFEKLVRLFETYADRPKALLYHAVKKLRYLPYSAEKLHREYMSLSRKYSVFSSSRCVNANQNAGKYYFPADSVTTTRLVEIEGELLRIPDKPEEVLTAKYKDFRKIPPLEDRVREVLNSYAHLKRYETLGK